jgi:phospholipase/lecithinase/hemolysin
MNHELSHPNVRGHHAVARAILARLAIREPRRIEPMGTEWLGTRPVTVSAADPVSAVAADVSA